MKGSTILAIQGILHLMVIVMQGILLLGDADITYGLIIPLILHILVMFAAQSALGYNHSKELVSLIAPKEKQE